MTLPVLIQPERVREIAAESFGVVRADVEAAINAAAPEIARAVLVDAAKRISAIEPDPMECRMATSLEDLWKRAMNHAARELIMMAHDAGKEIADAD